MRLLNIHIHTNHQQNKPVDPPGDSSLSSSTRDSSLNTFSCQNRENSFDTLGDSTIHSIEQNEQPSPSIPQLDGVDDMLDILGSKAPPAVLDLITKFALNQKRQLSGLAKHSKLPDFVIETNDSGKNVNVQCSSGFYEAVAKPAFSSLSSGFQLEILSVLVECVEIRKSCDLAGSQPGILLKFKLHGFNTIPTAVSVTVHLHHTQQKVQLQGGAALPDGGTAAVWFTQNILKQRFTNEAKNKKFDIDAINAVLSSITNAEPIPPPVSQVPEHCPHCLKRFSGQSKPVPCVRCNQFKHKAKCGPCPSTQPGCSVPSSSSPLPTTSSRTLRVLSSAPTITFVSSQLVTTGVSSTITSTTVSMPESPGSSGAARSASLMSSSTATVISPSLNLPPNKRLRPDSCQITSSNSQLPISSLIVSQGSSLRTSLPETSLAIPSLSSTSLNSLTELSTPSQGEFSLGSSLNAYAPIFSNNHAQPNIQGRKRKSNKNADKSQEQNEIDFLKIELNAVRTESLELESKNKDLEKRVKIMSEVIKMHEQNRVSQSYSNLFPGSSPPASTSVNTSPNLSYQPCTQPQHCHLQTTPSCYINSCAATRHCHCALTKSGSNDIDNNVQADLKELKMSVNRLQGEIVDVVDKLEALNDLIKASNPTAPAIPLFKNPHEIPELHRMESITDAETLSTKEPANESVISIEELVPDIINDNPALTLPTPHPHLNYQNSTIQLSQ